MGEPREHVLVALEKRRRRMQDLLDTAAEITGGRSGTKLAVSLFETLFERRIAMAANIKGRWRSAQSQRLSPRPAPVARC